MAFVDKNAQQPCLKKARVDVVSVLPCAGQCLLNGIAAICIATQNSSADTVKRLFVCLHFADELRIGHHPSFLLRFERSYPLDGFTEQKVGQKQKRRSFFRLLRVLPDINPHIHSDSASASAMHRGTCPQDFSVPSNPAVLLP